MKKDQYCNHDCNQGRDCPVRAGTHKPAEAMHQIQEQSPATALDALREAEAALEVAIARILKSDPGHSISVTSEAKALVAVRAALAATPAKKSNSAEFDGIKTSAPVVLPEPDFLQRHEDVCGDEVGPPTAFYTADTVRALVHQVLRDLPDGAPGFAMPAPHAQADTRDAEQERWMEIGKAIERACIDQPESTEIVISLERDAGTVTMFDQDGNEHDQFSHEDGFAGVVNAAIEAAIAAAKGE